MRLSFFIIFCISQTLAFSQTKTSEKAAIEYFINKYPNGQKEAEGKYINGKEHDKWMYWYSTGQLKQVANFNVGRLHGNVTYYYPNGDKKDEGFFVAGKQHGNYTSWYSNKNLSLSNRNKVT